MRVVGHDDGDDGHLRLDREVECAFLERQQVRRPRVRSRALGEDEDALPLAPHVCGRVVEGGARGGAVRAVDEDGFGEGHWGGWVSFSCNEMRCRGMEGGGDSMGNDGGERHTEPAQKRYPLQTLLGRDAAPAREDAAEHQDVEFPAPRNQNVSDYPTTNPIAPDNPSPNCS